LPQLLFVLGTRPEAVKLCPVIHHLARSGQFRPLVCVTAQHRDLLDQVLGIFSVQPDYDLNVMRPGQSLGEMTGRMLTGLDGVLRQARPDMVVVQGDTTTTFCGALAAFYHRIPVAHVEAGLRTGDLQQPFPEEANRVLTTQLTALHFPPTAAAAANLRREHVPAGRIVVTGNTGIDGLMFVQAELAAGRLRPAPDLPPAPSDGAKMVLVTSHRRESFGQGFARICEALRELAQRPDVRIVFPVHPNPQVREPVYRLLGHHPRIALIEPQDYVSFVQLMTDCHLILTDSGGVQEEAPSLGKPVLVLREVTERPEAVQAGTSLLVGTDPARIVQEAARLLDDPAEYQRRSQMHNPYGDGQASARLEAAFTAYFAGTGSPGRVL